MVKNIKVPGKTFAQKVLQMVRYNFWTLFIFELVYKIMIAVIFIPIATAGFNFTMGVAGFRYLTLENIGSFLLNPITLVLLLLLAIYLTMVTLFDISTIIIIFDHSYHHHKIRIIDAVKASLVKCIKFFRPRNFLVIPFVLLLIPLLNFGIGSNVITSINLPEFIVDYIFAKPLLLVVVIAGFVALAILLMKWIYSLHYMVLENKSFEAAKKSSKNLIRKNLIKDFLKILIIQVVLAVLYNLIVFGLVELISLVNSSLSDVKVLASIIIAILSIILIVCFVVVMSIATAVSYAIISGLYYEHKVAAHEKIPEENYGKITRSRKNTARLKVILAVVGGAAVIGASIVSYQIMNGEIKVQFASGDIDVTAHRGASVKYPENTMAAFVGAKELGADWAELDVQQTKDHKIVVSHDPGLKRTTGVDKQIIDMTYDEISKLDAGSFFNSKFAGEKIPLLDQVLEYADKNDLKLNIELKPTGHEQNFEQEVVDLINKYNFKDRCVVTSQFYYVLENLKKIDPSIKTIYVMSVAIGNITDLADADGYSVEASNIDFALVNLVHNSGKDIYAWTINTEESIDNMINMGVDNIITDDIELGKELTQRSKNGDLFHYVMRALNAWF